MATGYLQPILDAYITILQANFNTKIDLINNAAAYNWNTNAFTKAIEAEPGEFGFPHIEVFPFGTSEVDSNFTSDNIEILWRIATVVSFVANNAEDLITRQDMYLTALIQSIPTGSSGNQWTLNGECDLLNIIEVAFHDETGEESGQIYGACFAIWECSKEYDPT